MARAVHGGPPSSGYFHDEDQTEDASEIAQRYPGIGLLQWFPGLPHNIHCYTYIQYMRYMIDTYSYIHYTCKCNHIYIYICSVLYWQAVIYTHRYIYLKYIKLFLAHISRVLTKTNIKNIVNRALPQHQTGWRWSAAGFETILHPPRLASVDRG